MATTRQEIVGQIAAQRARQNASLLRIYNYYRIVLGVALLVIFIREIGERLLGSLDPDAFVVTAAGYIGANTLIAAASFLVPRRYYDRQTLGFLVVVADTLALTLLMHLSEGVSSGLGALIIVSVAAGSILVMGRIATVLPAIATIAVLYEEFYLSLIPGTLPPDFFQAGVLGALYFGTSLFIQDVSRRLQTSEILSMERAAEVAALERLNRLIVQRMRTGIIVLDPGGSVRLINEAARALLGTGTITPGGASLPDALATAWHRWRADPDHRPAPFRAAANTPEVQISFSLLARESSAETLVFIEDNTELQQRAQQLKLAALGRLSASIAHEIRNPLGAISHAAQLLRESPDLEKPDARLADIIQTHSRRMNGVIQNVLELSRRRTPEPRMMAMKEWLEQFVEQFRETRDAPAEIDLVVEPSDVVVRIDPGQLGQVLTNLVGNGMRYSEKRTGRPWVRLEGGIDDAGRPWLDVVDEGPGIEPAQRQHLFEPFFTTEDTGTGLGLYISRELCEANQVQLGYEPAGEHGSCFRLHFPHPQRQPIRTDD
jgi:two-component system sensor histidine kinase PilS (NtrC family)